MSQDVITLTRVMSQDVITLTRVMSQDVITLTRVMSQDVITLTRLNTLRRLSSCDRMAESQGCMRHLIGRLITS